MKFGLLLPFAGRGIRPGEFFAELRAETIEAEANGFDACFIGERHQQDGFTSPLHVLAALSGCTTRIRLGSGVLRSHSIIRCTSPRTRPWWTSCRAAGSSRASARATGGRTLHRSASPSTSASRASKRGSA